MDKKLSKGFEKAPLPIQMVAAGTGACIADLCTFPFDTIKVRLQVQGEGAGSKEAQRGLFKIMLNLVKQEGIFALYNGLAAGLQRQMAFSAIRIGIYDNVKTFYLQLFEITDPQSLSIGVRTLAGITCGCFAVACAQPTDVVKIRFQASARSGAGAKGGPRYANTRAAYREILLKDGPLGLWQGSGANMARTAICNVSEVVCYDIIKDALLKYEVLRDGIGLHITTAALAGFITTIVVSPVDVVKTRYMNAPKGKYTGALNCAIVTMKKEGPLAFYKGVVPNFVRLVSWNLVMWVSYERIKILVANYYNERERRGKEG